MSYDSFLKRRQWWIFGALFAIGLFLFVSCVAIVSTASDDSNGALRPGVAVTAQASSPLPSTVEQSAGTRANPIPSNTVFSVGDWQFNFLPANLDAAEIVQAENMFNDPPEPGHSFAMSNVVFTYNGPDSESPFITVTLSLVGTDGNMYSTYDPGCGVIPEDYSNINQMFTGATSSGNVCVSAPTDVLQGAVWQVSIFLDGNDEVYVSLV